MTQHLIEYVPVEGMVTAYHDAIDEIRRAHELLLAARDRLVAACGNRLRSPGV